jgi:ABC-type transport system substrate-binding protein
MTKLPVIFAALALFVAACTPAGTSRGTDTTGGASAPAEAPTFTRTLNVAIRVEPATVQTRPFRSPGVGLYMPSRMFNAQIAMLDNNGKVVPYLAQSLPQLNTDSWKVTPDGKMETTYPLKANLTWHDGAPLTAEDFVFSWKVYTVPSLGHSNLLLSTPSRTSSPLIPVR